MMLYLCQLDFLMNTLCRVPKQRVFTLGLLIFFCGQIGMLPPEAGMLALGGTVNAKVTLCAMEAKEHSFFHGYIYSVRWGPKSGIYFFMENSIHVCNLLLEQVLFVFVGNNAKRYVFYSPS